MNAALFTQSSHCYVALSSIRVPRSGKGGKMLIAMAAHQTYDYCVCVSTVIKQIVHKEASRHRSSSVST